VQFGAIAPRAGAQPRWIDLGEERDIYLARVDWADATHVAFQRQSRDQKRLDLVLANVADGTQRTLLTETAKTWINLHDDLHFLAKRRAFLWSSERSGFRQLYLYDLDGKLLRQVSATAWPIDKVLAVDEGRGLAYVAAPGPDPVQKQVYAYALDGEANVRAITTRTGFHEAVFADDASVFVDTYSDIDTPPQVRLHRAHDGRELAVLEPNVVDEQHPWFPYRDETLATEFGTLAGPGGETLHWRAIRPRGFAAAQRWPVVIRVYGGPHVQVVQRAWDARWGLFDRWLAQQGYVVFSLDNRGSARRGTAFEDALHERMGTVEVEDQLAGVDWLARQPWVDAERIAVFGWSYGGYMTLRLLAAAPGRFAAGVAGAPVTDWSLYDTHYTERYMGTPARNAAGYARGSVLAHADRIADPLLLIHGMADDNVLFAHTTKLLTLLQHRGQPFELMTYPGEKHGVATPAMRAHNYATIARFLAGRLAPGRAATGR
jgi:dipeptidyl-peptidase 4